MQHATLLPESRKVVYSEVPDTFQKLRGQCYDGCSTMARARTGVAVKIQEVEPRAVFTHCYGHALNLAVSDTITKLPRMKDCLDTCSLLHLLRMNTVVCFLSA